MQFVFTTAEDGKVCPQCSTLEGLVFDVDEEVVELPVHSNCRCRMLLFNESDSPLLPYLPAALGTSVAVGLARNNNSLDDSCPEGYHWDEDAATCLPDDE